MVGFKFPRLRWRMPQQYADSNLRCAWLLGLLADVPPFVDQPPELRVLALQSALFMIGYDIRNGFIQ